jgi:hypothetical protein
VVRGIRGRPPVASSRCARLAGCEQQVCRPVGRNIGSRRRVREPAPQRDRAPTRGDLVELVLQGLRLRVGERTTATGSKSPPSRRSPPSQSSWSASRNSSCSAGTNTAISAAPSSRPCSEPIVVDVAQAGAGGLGHRVVGEAQDLVAPPEPVVDEAGRQPPVVGGMVDPGPRVLAPANR